MGLVAPQHMGSLFPDQGLNPHPLHWKADSLPLDHQGSPSIRFFYLHVFLLLSAGLQSKYVLLPHLCLHGLGNSDKCNAACEPVFSTVTQLLLEYLSTWVTPSRVFGLEILARMAKTNP